MKYGAPFLFACVVFASSAIGGGVTESTTQEVTQGGYPALGDYTWQSKELPSGFFHFRPVSPGLAMMKFSSGGAVLCRESANAISFGHRLWHYPPELALENLLAEWHKQPVCYLRKDLTLTPLEESVRAVEIDRPVYILMLKDQRGGIHYIGKALRPANPT